MALKLFQKKLSMPYLRERGTVLTARPCWRGAAHIVELCFTKHGQKAAKISIHAT